MSRYELSRDEVRLWGDHQCRQVDQQIVLDSQVLEQKQAFDLLDIDGNGKVTYQEVKDLDAQVDARVVTAFLLIHCEEMNAKLGQPMSEQDSKKL